MNEKLTLIVVTHNSAQWLPEFFGSWKAAVAEAQGLTAAMVEIVVADCASTDESREMARGLAGVAAEILYLGNVGYGAVVNRAAAVSRAPWMLICNPDLSFSREFVRSFIDPQLLALSEASPAWHGAACLAPRLLNADGSVQASVGRFPTVGGLLRDQFRARARRKYLFPQPMQSTLVDWATGACLLVRREKFTEVGGFDEQFFLYVEEVDLQRRLGAANGQTWWVEEATVTHHAPNAERKPRAEVQKWAARGTLRYFAKHGTFVQLMAYRKLAFFSGRLSLGEVGRSRAGILGERTGP